MEREGVRRSYRANGYRTTDLLDVIVGRGTGFTLPPRLDPRLERDLSREEKLDEPAIHRGRRRKRTHEVFHGMRRLLDGGEADHPRQALERVQRTRNLLQLKRLRRYLGIDGEERSPKRGKELIALGEVVVDELLEELAAARHAHVASRSGRSWDTNVVAANGFVR